MTAMFYPETELGRFSCQMDADRLYLDAAFNESPVDNLHINKIAAALHGLRTQNDSLYAMYVDNCLDAPSANQPDDSAVYSGVADIEAGSHPHGIGASDNVYYLKPGFKPE